MIAHLRGIDHDIRLGTDISDQFAALRIVAEHCHHGLAHPGGGPQRRFHFPCLDPQSTQCELVVGAAEVFQPAVGQSAYPVAGRVQPFPGPSIGHEPIGLGRRVDITPSQADTGEMQLAGHPHRNDLSRAVEHHGAHILDRAAEGDRGTGQYLFTADIDGCFGRPVVVVQRRIRQQPMEFGGHIVGQRLTAGGHVPQRIAPGDARLREPGSQHRRYEMYDRDLLCTNGFHQIPGIAMSLRRSRHRPGSVHQRVEQIPDRHIEGERRLLQHPILGTDPNRVV